MIQARLDADGMGYELFNDRTGLTCNQEVFGGHYARWPFCKPYDEEEWWLFIDEPEAVVAAGELQAYLDKLPDIISPARISFIRDTRGFHLTCNREPAGSRLFKGEDEKSPWPFHGMPNWQRHADRKDAIKAVIRLQEYLDGRSSKLSK